MPTSLKQAFSGGSGLIELAPNLDWNDNSSIVLTPNGSPQIALDLSGKFAVSSLGIQTYTTNPVRVELIVDGELIIDTEYTASSNVQSNFNIYGSGTSNITADVTPFLVKSSLLLRLTGTNGDDIIRGGALLRAIK